MICVSIAEESLDKALEVASGVQGLADLIEVRLDVLAEPRAEEFIRSINKPLLFTCRPEWEGGKYSGSEDERIKILRKALDDGAAYVDVELRTERSARQELIESARNKGVKSIVSWHDFKTTASKNALESVVQEIYQTGAAIGKLVTMARDYQDVLRVLELQVLAHEVGLPLCAFCMGEAGMISRVATMKMGGHITYAAPDGGQAAAPGQLPVSKLVKIRELLNAD